ncbi:MAG: glycosyltransferase [Nitrososphaerota archaeon]
MRAIRGQTFKDFELITDDSPGNEYIARNNAARRAKGEVLFFVDDDAVPREDCLENAYKYFLDPRVKILTGVVEGDLWGQGVWYRVSKPYWFIGTCLFVRREAFFEVGGFEETWGLGRIPRGWRSDTALGYEVVERYGDDCYVHAEDVVVVHPGPMQSIWEPEVEAKFYKKYRRWVLSYITPYDPRICQFVYLNRIEEDPLILKYLTSDQKVRYDFIRVNTVPPVLNVGDEEDVTFYGTVFDHVNLDTDDFLRKDVQQLFKDRLFNTVVYSETAEHMGDLEKVVSKAGKIANRRVVVTIPIEHCRETYNDVAELLSRACRGWRISLNRLEQSIYIWLGVVIDRC